MITADRCVQLARDIAEHIDPQHCPECACIATLTAGIVQTAKQGAAAYALEWTLAQALACLTEEATA